MVRPTNFILTTEIGSTGVDDPPPPFSTRKRENTKEFFFHLFKFRVLRVLRVIFWVGGYRIPNLEPGILNSTFTHPLNYPLYTNNAFSYLSLRTRFVVASKNNPNGGENEW